MSDASHHKHYWDADGTGGVSSKLLIADMVTANVTPGDFDLR